MSYSIDELCNLAINFEKLAAKKDLDPKAEVRSRGKVVFPAESPKVKDNKDHFPINDADQARNALARAGQYTKAPSWYKGTLESLKSSIQRAVHKHYPSIGKEKKSSETVNLLVKAAEKFEKPLIFRLFDQLKDAIKIGDEESIKELKQAIDEECTKLPSFKYKE